MIWKCHRRVLPLRCHGFTVAYDEILLITTNKLDIYVLDSAGGHILLIFRQEPTGQTLDMPGVEHNLKPGQISSMS